MLNHTVLNTNITLQATSTELCFHFLKCFISGTFWDVQFGDNYQTVRRHIPADSNRDSVVRTTYESNVLHCMF